jgi:inhibitor of cysteine peptidase
MKRLTYALATFAMLVAPLAPLRAATLAPGDLIKASGNAVYYYNTDGKRYVFPNEKTYFTWYTGFTNIKTVTDSELAAIQIGGNVTYRPGVKLVKLTTDPKVYAVDAPSILRWVKTESLAQSYYGADWAKQVNDLPDAFFADYMTGTAIGTTTDYNRATLADATPNIGAILNTSVPTTETTITQMKGTDFSISLASNPTTGYGWTATFAPDKFTKVSDVYTPATTTVVGSGGTEKFTFTPLSAGTYDIVFSYARSFETGVAPIDVRTYHVNVGEPAAPITPTASSTVQGATYTLTASKTQAQALESVDLFASTNDTSPITKIEIYAGDALYASCPSARSCSTTFTLPNVGLPDSYAFTAKFYTSANGVVDAHASTQVVALPVNSAIILILDHAQLKPGQAAGIHVQLGAGLNASKIVINVDGSDLKTCSSSPSTCLYNDLLNGTLGSKYVVYAWVQNAQSLRYKSAPQTIPLATNDNPTLTLSASNASILPTEHVDITASASDSDGISSVQILKDGAILKTCNGAAPCTVNAGPFNLAAGNTVSFTATAVDLLGATTTASGATVTIR